MSDSPGMALIKANEGCVLRAYDDKQPKVHIAHASQVKGRLTIGYGATGPDIKVGTIWTQAQADADLALRLKVIDKQIENLVHVPINANQRGALEDFIYNEGVEAFAKSSLLKELNEGNYSLVPAELYKWVMAWGEVSTDLRRRRMQEATLWCKAVLVAQAVSA